MEKAAKEIKFSGPFKLTATKDGASIFSVDAAADKPGIYIWTIRAANRIRVLYVGISKQQSVAIRTWGHIRAYVCGDYRLRDMTELRNLDQCTLSKADSIHWKDRALKFSRLSELSRYEELFAFLDEIEIYFSSDDHGIRLDVLESALINHFGRAHLENSKKSTRDPLELPVDIRVADVTIPLRAGSSNNCPFLATSEP